MGGSSFSSSNYLQASADLAASGQQYAKSAQVHKSGDYGDVSKVLDPRELKDGIRESCFPDGIDDILSVALVFDLTASFGEIPYYLQKELPNIIEVLKEQNVSEHPQVMFMGIDDEQVMPRACFQMSQFESGSAELLEAMNELVISHHGGGNDGESYHLPFYALANHTKLETFERDGDKGVAVFICDEPAFHRWNGGWANGKTPGSLIKECFGTSVEDTPMVDSVKKTLEKYDVIVIRPRDCSWGQDASVTQEWRAMLVHCGGNPELVIEVDNKEAVITTIVMAIGALKGIDHSQLVDVLTAKGAPQVQAASDATKSIVPSGGGAVAKATATAAIDTGAAEARERE